MLGALIFIGVVLMAGAVLLWGLGAILVGLGDAFRAHRAKRQEKEYAAWEAANPEAAAYGKPICRTVRPRPPPEVS